MPISKRRKRKNGKVVGSGERKNRAAHDTRVERLANAESGVTLQELINVLAYQELNGLGPEVDGTIDPETTGLEDLKVIDNLEEIEDGR